MSDTDDYKYGVATFESDQRSDKALGLLFKHRAQGMFEIVNAEQASIALFDADGADSESAWKNYRDQYPDLPAVIISEKPEAATVLQDSNALILKKPLVADALLRTLALSVGEDWAAIDKHSTVINRDSATASKVAASLSGRTNKPKVRPVASAGSDPSKEYYYDADEFVFGQLIQAIRMAKAVKKMVKATCWENEYIAVDSDKGQVACSMSQSKLRQMAIMKTSGKAGVPTKIEFFGKGELSNLFKSRGKSNDLYTLDSFMWLLASLTARGRIPAGVSLDAPVYLSSWPNFSRLTSLSNALRISALWIQQPRSLKDLSEALDVPLVDVLSFYSAASAIGLAGPAQRNSDTLIEAGKVARHRKRGLFSAIVQKLKGGVKAANGSETEDGTELAEAFDE